MALNGLFCADVPLRNYSLTHFGHNGPQLTIADRNGADDDVKDVFAVVFAGRFPSSARGSTSPSSTSPSVRFVLRFCRRSFTFCVVFFVVIVRCATVVAALWWSVCGPL